MIHLHLNDYPGHSSTVAGKYSGLVIYIPAQQYNNSSTTKAVADAMFKRLSLYNPIDNLPIESGGIIDDPELIAVGVGNTADAASMLIEYDYIYEPQFVNPKVRSLALKDLAYQTYLGLQDFFTKNANVSVDFLLPPVLTICMEYSGNGQELKSRRYLCTTNGVIDGRRLSARR